MCGRVPVYKTQRGTKMKTELLLLLSNATSIACVIAAANLASKGTEGWGWFLLIALLSGVYPKSIGD
jgi:hypothetical protein